jgi:hypothetical protein
MNLSSWRWLREHKWRLLLIGMLTLLMISPISDVYDAQDNIITPLTAAVFLAVILGTTERKQALLSLISLTIIWMIIGIVTDGSGLFVGPSLVAPMLFLVLLAAVFLLLADWMVRAGHINAEVLCAAICGYLLLGLFWAGLYAAAERFRSMEHFHDGFMSTVGGKLTNSDWLYFSYSTLTTVGYGDIVPRGGEVRMLAVVEAMVGLFYNTIVIARFVALYGIKVRQDSPPPN